MPKKRAARLSSGIYHLSVAFTSHPESKFLVVICIIIVNISKLRATHQYISEILYTLLHLKYGCTFAEVRSNNRRFHLFEWRWLIIAINIILKKWKCPPLSISELKTAIRTHRRWKLDSPLGDLLRLCCKLILNFSDVIRKVLRVLCNLHKPSNFRRRRRWRGLHFSVFKKICFFWGTWLLV